MTEETIGIRELKEHTSEVIRRVREERATYTVTHRGKAVARIGPSEDREDLPDQELVWERIDELAQEIGKHWPKGLSPADAVAEDRE